MDIQQGDVVISREKNSCDIRIVEGADDTGVLLVNGIKDEFYSDKEMDIFEERYMILCYREDRQDFDARKMFTIRR